MHFFSSNHCTSAQSFHNQSLRDLVSLLLRKILLCGYFSLRDAHQQRKGVGPV